MAVQGADGPVRQTSSSLVLAANAGGETNTSLIADGEAAVFAVAFEQRLHL